MLSPPYIVMLIFITFGVVVFLHESKGVIYNVVRLSNVVFKLWGGGLDEKILAQ